MKAHFLIVTVALFATVVGCKSETAEPPTITPEPSIEATPRDPIPTETPTATPDVSPTVAQAELPPFNLTDYLNGVDIAEFMEDLGEERPFPPDLLPDSPEKPEDQVREIVQEFLNDSRVVFVKEGFRDVKVEGIDDYCDNGLSVNIYLRPDAARGPGAFTGVVNPWSVEHTTSTEWNRPYVAGDPFGNRIAYFSRGWDGVGASVLSDSKHPGLARIGGTSDEHVRVFSNPGCADPQLLTEVDPAAWNLLNVGVVFDWPEELEPTSPQMEPERVVQMWREAFSNVLVFDNLNGFPWEYVCDGRGVGVSRLDPSTLGEPYTFTLEDAAEIYANSAIFWREYDNRDLGLQPVLTLLPDQARFHRQIFAVELTDCSIEEGIALAERVRVAADK